MRAPSALSFPALIGPQTPVPAVDRRGLPPVRRTSQGHVIALHEPGVRHAGGPWLVIYSACPPECTGVNGLETHPTNLQPGWRVAEATVATWPFLNQWGYHEDQVLEHVHSLTKGMRALRRENGRLADKLGATRAELARERERRRAASYPGAPATMADMLQAVIEDRGIHPFTQARALHRAAVTRPEPTGPARFAPACRLVDGTWVHGRPHTCPASTNRRPAC